MIANRIGNCDSLWYGYSSLKATMLSDVKVNFFPIGSAVPIWNAKIMGGLQFLVCSR